MKYDFNTTPDHRSNNSYRWGMKNMPADVIGMGTADLDYYCAPCIREALVKVAEENCYNYRQRPSSYYDAIIGFYRRNYGLDIRKEWLSSVPSTIGAVRMALGIYAEKGDSIIVQTPLFGPLKSAVEGADCRLLENPLKAVDGHYEIDFDDFEKKVKEHHPSCYLLVNPQNPTGKVFRKEELVRLVDICKRNGVTVISDEVHGLITYDGNTFTPILSLGEKSQAISVQIMSLSKGYNIMSLPHAVITIPDEEKQKKWMRQIQAYSFGYATNSFAMAAVTSIMKGEAEEWMKQLTEYLHGNLEEMLSFIKKNRLPLIPYRPEGSFLIWIDCRKAGIGEKDLDEFFMDKAHIDLDDGEKNFGEEGRGFVRINFAVTRAVLREALERIRKAIDENSLNHF